MRTEQTCVRTSGVRGCPSQWRIVEYSKKTSVPHARALLAHVYYLAPYLHRKVCAHGYWGEDGWDCLPILVGKSMLFLVRAQPYFWGPQAGRLAASSLLCRWLASFFFFFSARERKTWRREGNCCCSGRYLNLTASSISDIRIRTALKIGRIPTRHLCQPLIFFPFSFARDPSISSR